MNINQKKVFKTILENLEILRIDLFSKIELEKRNQEMFDSGFITSDQFTATKWKLKAEINDTEIDIREWLKIIEEMLR
jgi:hypothetical protein